MLDVRSVDSDLCHSELGGSVAFGGKWSTPLFRRLSVDGTLYHSMATTWLYWYCWRNAVVVVTARACEIRV